MSVICGIVNMKGKRVAIESGKSMMEKLDIYKLDSKDIYIKGQVFFGCGIQYITKESKNEKLPYFDEDSGLVITADAIIDNRIELFENLSVPREKQEDITDSELILLAYKHWGYDCVKFLIGDFAFAIWDEKNKKLFCARDHVGKRTFYYYFKDNIFIFCTVVRPIFSALDNTCELNEKWIADFLSIAGAVHEIEYTETVYKDIYQLPAASTIVLNNNSITYEKYWDPFKTPKLKLKTDKEYEEAFRKVLSEAVECRLRSFGDIGISLSGGLDSTSIAAIAARKLVKEGKKLKAFSAIPMVGYKDYLPKSRVADESGYIEAVASYVGNIDVNFCRSEGKNSLSDVEYFLDILEQPYKPLENLFWYNHIAETASSQQCKVLLDGQFGNATISFGHFFTHAVTLYRKGKIFKLLKEMRCYSELNKIPFSEVSKSVARAVFPYRIRKYVSKRVNKGFDRFHHLAVNLELYEKYDVERRMEDKGFKVPNPEKYYDLSEMKEMLINPVAFSHIGAVETKISLAHGILKRDPTRDKRVIEFFTGLPSEQFVRNGQERSIIRRAMNGLIPDEVRLNSSQRGLQSADWIQRLQPDWKSAYSELLDILEGENMHKYINIDKLKKELPAMEVLLDERNQYYVRMLLIVLVLSRFIKKHKNY